MDNIKELENALEKTKKEIKGRRINRERLLGSLYSTYFNSATGELSITYNDNINEKRNFFYLLDKGYFKTIRENVDGMTFRLSADGIDYIENLQISELESDINKEKEKNEVNNHDCKPLVN
ncbi:hypothetical protein KQI38_03405 [Tissierella carlieri]|uniref:hypothetical protein n=1 Tax=Tissierella carlieri TaxID=689904 RepID=UPI001C116AA0|nr:hypothetical protein [Tissierella carlieri]MBU5311060.1 hypothetical protein [Tissierella carlieri]